MAEVFGIFPTPVMHVAAALDAARVAALLGHFEGRDDIANNASDGLSHSAMLAPGDSPLLVDAAQRLVPHVAEFGALLFGEALGWSLKEMWVNVLLPGGRQAMHNHANSFVSGVVYLTPTHEDSRTVFMKSPGGYDFAFRNDHAGTRANPYNAQKWTGPLPGPGDLMLFPSGLLHAVPPNAGRERRVSMAFNAIPTQLDSWGYRIAFSG
jgi:uncharacterized protein (TIGR02466 family)